MVPIIDRELFFGNPEITSASLSPDGKYLAFVKPWKDTLNVWVKTREEPFDQARLMTAEVGRPIADYLWTRDGTYIVYVKDKDGDENYNVYAVDPGAPPAQGSEAPAARDLTGLEGVQVNLYSAPKYEPDIVYIGLNDRDKAWHDLYRLRISTGKRELMRKNTEQVAGWFFDLKGNLRLAFRVADNGDQELLRVDPNELTRVYSCNVFESCEPLRFHPDGRRVYLETNKGDDVDLTRLVLFDPATGQIEPVESDPLGRVDFGGCGFHEVTDELIYTSYEDDKVRRYFRDKEFEADFLYLEQQLPGKEVFFESRTRDDRIWVVSADSDVEPGETYIFDRQTRQLDFQFRIRENLPRDAMAEMKPLRYKSSDGMEIPAYLSLPRGEEPRNLPLLVVPHGGPWARDDWGYSSFSQFFANRGYAVLTPNFRGSTGFGKKFLNAGNGAWGREMQDDITWGVKHLVDSGIADPKRVGILGGSYGGYATLAGVAFTPDLYAAAVDIVGPSNLNTMLDSIPPYWEAGRKLLYARMADPTTTQGKQWLDERSPLFSADKIRTPLLVVQGANDPRVNRAEAEQIVIALRDRGFDVEYILAPDEGHGFARPVNNMAMFMAAEKFLAAHLGGRYQEGGTPEVVARLKEISVDPRTVTLTKKVDVMTVGLPQVTGDLRPGKFKYKARIEVDGEAISMKMSTEIKDKGDAWHVTDQIGMMMMSTKDTSVLEKGTLLTLKRSMSGTGTKVELDFSQGKAAGLIKIQGRKADVDMQIGGPVFADGPGHTQVIACLPLAEGYTAVFRNFDLQKKKPKAMRLEVKGVESIEVPAGAFECWRVELTSAEGGSERSTIWLSTDDRKTVKLSTIMLELAGARLEAELT
ncbi:MAG TPA: alpha/beta fold hydrolase [Bryobacteraceae bacterium]|jgi:dipeptidyl aminopeptidase/acylaminoacyl peptidase